MLIPNRKAPPLVAWCDVEPGVGLSLQIGAHGPTAHRRFPTPWCLAPPLLAVLFALVFRDPTLGLVAGIAGNLVVNGWSEPPFPIVSMVYVLASALVFGFFWLDRVFGRNWPRARIGLVLGVMTTVIVGLATLQPPVRLSFYALGAMVLALTVAVLGRRLWTPVVKRGRQRLLLVALAVLMAWLSAPAARFLATLLPVVDPVLMPAVAFLFAGGITALVGFPFTTSFVLLPVVGPLALAAAHGHPHAEIIHLLSTAAVLDGAILGAHVSPLSPVTALVAAATDSDLLDHTRHQLPYVGVVMVAALVFGYILTAWAGTSPITAYVAGAGALGIVLLVFGRPKEAQ